MSDHTELILQSINTRRAAVMRNTIVVLILICAVFAVKAVFAGVFIRIVLLVFAMLVAFLALIYNSKGDSRVALTLLFSAMWSCVLVATLTTNSVDSLVITWYVIAICLAGLLGGRRFCFYWVIIVLLTVLCIWLAYYLWPELERMAVTENKLVHARMHLLAQFVVMSTIVLSFVDINERYEAQLLEQMVQLSDEVAQRTKAEAAAVASDRAKTLFLANMSHEIRTPLNSIIGYSKRLLKRVTFADQKDADAIASVYRNGNGLLILVNELLDLANVEADNLHYAVAPFAVNTVVDECFSAIEPVAKNYGLQLQFSALDQINISGDRNRIMQIISSVIYFSIRQTLEGVIEVNVARSSRKSVAGVNIIVTDTGSGISEKEQETLFESHYQFVLNSNKELPISALSLVLAAKLVAMHGGSISVHSEVGRGSQFVIWLPINRPLVD